VSLYSLFFFSLFFLNDPGHDLLAFASIDLCGLGFLTDVFPLASPHRVVSFSLGAVIVSKDEDFARLTLLRPEPVAVVWLRLGNCRTATLLATMERVWPEIVRQLERATA